METYKNNAIQRLNRLSSTTLTRKLILILIGFMTCLTQIVVYAQTATKDDTTWGKLYVQVLSLTSGDPAVIISIMAFICGVLGAVMSQHKMMWLIGGISVPIAVQVGPSVYAALSGAVV